jgi:hypothetical protein
MTDQACSIPIVSIHRLRQDFPGKKISFEAEFSVEDFWAGTRAIFQEFEAIGAVPISVKCSASGTVFCSVIDSGQDLQSFAQNIANRNDLSIVRWTTALNF